MSSSAMKLGLDPDMDDASLTISCTAATSSARSFFMASWARLYASSFFSPVVIRRHFWVLRFVRLRLACYCYRDTDRVPNDIFKMLPCPRKRASNARKSSPAQSRRAAQSPRKDGLYLPRGASSADAGRPTHARRHKCKRTKTNPARSHERTVLHQRVLTLRENVADRRGPRLEPPRAQPLRVLHHVRVAADELVRQGVPRQLQRLDAVGRAALEGRNLRETSEACGGGTSAVGS